MSRKKNIWLQFAIISCIALFAVSCSKKLDPLSANLFTANPSPLEVVGSKVPVTITGKIPAKWFNKNVELSVTPVLKYDGGEAYGTTFNYQGEKVSGNGIVIPESSGATITMYSEFDYKPVMQKSELYLRFNASVKGKSVSLPDVKIAEGIGATAALADIMGNNPSVAPDRFQKVIQEAYDAQIMFLIQQAELRSSELNSSNLAAWKRLVEDADQDARKRVNVEVSAYASPDGGFKLNDALAEKRETNTTQYLEKEFKNNNINSDITAYYTAQDWDGFRKLIEASSIQDKQLILSVLSMYDDPEVREKEIKNISVVYKDIAETILPQLRRSRLTANVQIIGKSDEEINSAISKRNYASLSLEELLYAATLTTDAKEKENIYRHVTSTYPNDYRAWNNLGALYLQNGLVDEATKAFTKASQINPGSAESNANLALIALSNNDISKAEQLLGNASGASGLNEALGLLQLKKGEYTKAVQSYGDAKTNNAAIAQILTKDYSKAQKTLDAVSRKDAKTYYLGAIVAARTNNISGVVTNLRESIKLDSSLKSTALSDLELSKYMTNPDILNMLR
jgi:tetratricopeptide (TPR) repeat protein